MVIAGLIVAVALLLHYTKRLQRHGWDGEGTAPWEQIGRHWARKAERHAERHAEWHRRWADKADRHAERRRRREARHAACGSDWKPPTEQMSEQDLLRRARRRAAAETGFYAHLVSYLGVISLLRSST